MARKTIKAKIPADLVDKIAKAEGIVRGETETRLSFQRRCLALYDVKAGRTSYEATRKDPAVIRRAQALSALAALDGETLP